LTNEGGATSRDFKDALLMLRYQNNAPMPMGGIRTVEVQFTTSSGAESNVATAFIDVVELPLVPVDLGPDQQICEGETATFDAGIPNVDYEWSTGEESQIITVDASGQYMVTVTDGINCPGIDTVILEILPIVNVSLTGDVQICDNEPVNLIINTDSPFPLSIEIISNQGGTFSFPDVIGNYALIDLIDEETLYTITSVVPSQDACVTITDPEHFVDVYPSFNHSFEVSICEGDSIWLGFTWETEAGVYENTFNTLDGCDSVVTTTLSISSAITINVQGTTCDSASAGIFIEYLNNPNGCDTIIQTTVTLLPPDTTVLNASSCNLASTGIFTQNLSNQQGCDSVVITTITWIPPADTITLFQTTCDSSQSGVFQQILPDQMGCDSIVITTIDIGPADTTYAFGISCDISMIGVSQALYNNQQGCDSLVITTISAGQPDTNYINTTSCDSASLGVFEENFISANGCDSTVITTISYSASDSTFVQSASCDPDQVGVFVEQFINAFGCDSIVTTEVAFAISHYISLSSSTCNPADTGTFTEMLTNQFGCDSVITETVTLLPVDATDLFSTTCRSSEAGVFVSNLVNQYGCDSVVTLTVSLIPADTTIFSYKTCDPSQVGSIQNTFINQDGCDSLVIEETTLFPLPELTLEITSDYNGYAISCAGQSDGSASANVVGSPPFDYLWSISSTNQSISGLSAGSYAVTITDANGCTASGEVMLSEPEEFSISFIVSQPDCFDNQDGSITVEQSGGIESIRYSIDEINYQSSPDFSQLPGGTYTVTAIDANDCETKEIIWINVPLMVSVELGENMQLFPGDTVVINAIVNVPFDSLASIQWTGLINPNCPTCLSQPVAPIITTTYSVAVTSLDGCMDDDAMTLFLENDNDIYVPNIFSPNGDGINDVLVISAGSNVEQIQEFTVFDRWGNVVYTDDHFEANDIGHAWDGTRKGRQMNPGVFAYKLIVQFSDGTQDVVYGDITLMR
jgi:gliding motility-associated-like protein